jgi:hypothetical protein
MALELTALNRKSLEQHKRFDQEIDWLDPNIDYERYRINELG